MMQKCPKCSGTHIDQGEPRNDCGYSGYYSKALSLWKRLFTSVPQRMYVCLQCGYTETYTDIEKLKRKIPSA